MMCKSIPRQTPSSAQPTQKMGLGPLAATGLGDSTCWRIAIACGDIVIPAGGPGT